MPMKRAYFYASAVFSAALFGPAIAAEPLPCQACAEWNLPQEPFRIHGDSYYVGTKGLSSILLTSDEGHVLIDGGLPESAPLIVANIETLGFRIEDVELILNSHVHFDHAGGIAELQRISGAVVQASAWSAEALRLGSAPRSDPQFGVVLPFEPVAEIRVIEDGESLGVGENMLTAHFTAGHTPGGTSWTWESCEAENCLDIVYADSLTPTAADGFYFMFSRDYPTADFDLHESIRTLEALPCDIVLTPHPGFVDILQKYQLVQTLLGANVFVDPEGCRNYAWEMLEWVGRREREELSTFEFNIVPPDSTAE